MTPVVNDVISGCIMLAIGIIVEMIRQQNKKNNQQLMSTINNHHQEAQRNFNTLFLEITRVRILTLIYDDPTSHNEILDLFDKYEKAGGNGSTKQRVHEWKQKEGIS